MKANKNFFYCIVVKDNIAQDGFYAYATKINQSQNLYSFIRDYPKMYAMNACSTMKEAQELAQFQNDSFKANGTYALDKQRSDLE